MPTPRSSPLPAPAWVKPTLKSLVELRQLPQNWDGYGAVRVQEQIAQRAPMFLVEVPENHAPAPSVVPLSDGGIQAEWHRRARNLEALLKWVEAGKAPDTPEASRRDQSGKVVRSRPLCQYRLVARYKGSGSTDDAASFVCSANF